MNSSSINDVQALQQLAALQQRELELLHKKLEKLSAENDRLKGQDAASLQQRLAQLERELANAKSQASSNRSERRGRDDKPDKTPKERTEYGPRDQPDLEVVQETFLLDEADRSCPSCGKELPLWEGQFETSEEITVVERKFVVTKVQRQKYLCDCGCIETAMGPAKVVPGGRYSAEFAFEVAINKYLDHLPIERQVRRMQRQGLQTDSQTLFNQLWHLSQLARPSYEAIREYILSQSVVGLDTTGWPNLGSSSAKKWQMWCLTAEDAAFYAIRDTKGTQDCLEILGGFSGTVVCDQAQTHEAARKAQARDGPALTIAACWGHARRRFIQCEPNFPEATPVLDMIAELYAIEKKAAMNGEDLATLRKTESKAVLEKMRGYLVGLPVVRGTGLHRAVRYALAHWERLSRFVDDPKIWLDNNLTERSLRGPVVGRKNHYGSKSRRGTEVAAVMYTVMGTARLSGLDPRAYLRELVARAATAPGREVVLLPHDLR